uniref:PucR family transcriptional regulator n=1 Tax=Rhodococcus qingshengii TaxID=334542 RepID=UPI00211A29E6|nr:PucR family transcriptional regulator [Rhodococcus qingshengii]
MKQLSCEIRAGAGGLNRPIVWAHVCELDDPWNFLSRDELLMTTGICVPKLATEQARLISNLHAAGLAAVAIGDDLRAPPLMPSMLEQADRLEFPVISVKRSTPFSAIGRTVAVAAQSDQISRIARLSKLYDVARSLADAPLLDRLSSELGYELHVVDVEFGTEPLPGPRPLPETTIELLCEKIDGDISRMPVRTTVSTSEGQLLATAFALSTHRRCVLVAEGPSEVDLDAFVLLHAQSLVGIELERWTRDRERTDQVESELFDQIIDGSIGSDVAQPRLDQLGLTRQDWIVFGFDAHRLRHCRVMLGDNAIPKITGQVGEEGYGIVAARDLVTVTELLKPSVSALGTSATTASVQRLPDSVRQARWALHAARAQGGGIAEYSTAAPLFLPRTLTEAQFATREILGDLIDHDKAHTSQLVDTLEAFLTLDRSWAATAEKLMIHRQTLAYRLKRIEEISGRSTKHSADLATLWMALISRKIGANDPAD